MIPARIRSRFWFTLLGAAALRAESVGVCFGAGPFRYSLSLLDSDALRLGSVGSSDEY